MTLRVKRLSVFISWLMAFIICSCCLQVAAATNYKVRPITFPNGDQVQGGTDYRRDPTLNNLNEVMIPRPFQDQVQDDSIPYLIWSNGELYQPMVNRQPGAWIVPGTGFNDLGQVVGVQNVYNDSTGQTQYIPFIASRYDYNTLGWSGDTEYVDLRGINDNGKVVGGGAMPTGEGSNFVSGLVVWDGAFASDPAFYGTAWVYNPDSGFVLRDGDSLWSWLGTHVNNNGSILGEFYVRIDQYNSGQYRPFTLGIEAETLPKQVPLFPNSGAGYQLDLGANNWVVGYGYKEVEPGNFKQHAFLWDGASTEPIDLHPPTEDPLGYSSATRVNSNGEILMFSQTGQWYYKNGEYTNIHDLQLEWADSAVYLDPYDNEIQPFLSGVYDINDEGVILGFGNNPLDTVNYFVTLWLLIPDKATYVVNSTGDASDTNPGDGKCSTGDTLSTGEDECTCRAAIEESNAHEGEDVINFNIQEPDLTVQLNGPPLPPLTDKVLIDGSSQPDQRRIIIQAKINFSSRQMTPMSSSDVDGQGIEIQADGSTVKDLTFSGFGRNGGLITANQLVTIDNCTFIGNDSAGLVIANGSKHTVRSSLFGREDDGHTVKPNFGDGIRILKNATECVISDNVIGSNIGNGIHILGVEGAETLPSVGKHTIVQNLIGINESLDAKLTNNIDGIKIERSSGNKIGGGLNDGNTIVSSNGYGIEIIGCDSNVISGNDIGIPNTLASGYENMLSGIAINRVSTKNRIEDNVISGNISNGIFIEGVYGIVPRGQRIIGNFIGTDRTGTMALGNGGIGILAQGAQENVIGSATDGNIILDNKGGGIQLLGNANDTIQGNYIGVKATGIDTLPNTDDGILLRSTSNVLIGGDGEGEGNIIGGQVKTGIYLDGSSVSDIHILGNFIGTNADTNQSLPNGNGIEIREAQRVFIGGASPQSQNMISWNQNYGLYIYRTDSTVVSGNIINHNSDIFGDGSISHGAGILINGTANTIGGSTIDSANTIRDNFGYGVKVENGTGNRIRSNRFSGNGRIAIDLSDPPGVSPNDQGDVDTGPNNGQNYPVIDSVIVSSGQSTVYWYINDPIGTNLTIDFYLSSESDATRYGEGDSLLMTQNIFVPLIEPYYRGQTVFPIEFDEHNFISLLATDDDGNTSEFSASWPGRIFKLIDGQGNPLAYRSFESASTSHQPPGGFIKSNIDTVYTNDSGKVYRALWQAPEGDSLRFGKYVGSVLRDVPTVLATNYSVTLDNMKFDTLGIPFYAELDTSLIVEDTLDHSEFAVNIIVSIDWDAQVGYLESARNAFRSMSNLMYDCFDGQFRLDTVYIFDDKVMWDHADIHINADNMVWPHVDGIRSLSSPIWNYTYPVEMPRIHYLSSDNNRNKTAIENPLDLDDPSNFSTWMHELGHYYFQFGDEYDFGWFGERCIPNKNYGIMDGHMNWNGPTYNEISSSYTYHVLDCRNNDQWDRWKMSCWEATEQRFEQVFNGYFLPIIRPSERDLSIGGTRLEGPNDDLKHLDLDVGELVVFPIGTPVPAARSKKILVKYDMNDLPAGNTGVTLYRNSFSGYTPRTIKQGNTADDGTMIVLGMLPLDNIIVSKDAFYIPLTNAKVAAVLSPPRAWSQGSMGVTQEMLDSPDSIIIPVHLLDTAYQQVVEADLGANDLNLIFHVSQPFDSISDLVHTVDTLTLSENTMTLLGNDYQTTITDSLRYDGLFTQSFKTDSGDFTVPFDYQHTIFTPRTVVQAFMNGGVQKLVIEDASAPFEQLLLLTSSFPPIYDGSADAVPVGDVLTIATYPDVTFDQTAALYLTYAAGDIPPDRKDGDFYNYLRIAHFDPVTKAWEALPSYPDTAHSYVVAAISAPGIYSLVLTDISTDIGDQQTGNNLPLTFELYQNYPNPFNPRTTIEFALPKEEQVVLNIYNILGQRVRTLVDAVLPAGHHTIEWDGLDNSKTPVATGIYQYRIEAGDFMMTKKMLLLK